METKICSKCGIEKPIEEFAFRDKTKGTRRAECKKCISQRQKDKYHKQKAELNEFKKQKVCEKCGESRFYLLDFHHIDPNTKIGTVARLITHSNSKTAYDEIDKCICLCANCHREFHWLEKENNITLEEYLNQNVAGSYNSSIGGFEPLGGGA